MDERPKRTDKQLKFLFLLKYEGPWERWSNRLYGLRKDASLRWVVQLDSKGWKRWLARLGDYCEARDRAWRDKYVARGEVPHDRWLRRTHGADKEA